MSSRPPLRLSTTLERRVLKQPVRIATGVIIDVVLLVVTARRGDGAGMGEATGVPYLGDTAQTAEATIHARIAELNAVTSRDELRGLLPPGGARNAVDCALWALEADERGCSIADLAGVGRGPLITTYTISADAPHAMASAAAALRDARALKLKLTGDPVLDGARVEAVRAVRGDAWIGVDANQSYMATTLQSLMPTLVDAKVAQLEQPLARGQEADMVAGLIPTVADESCQNLVELEDVPGRFNAVNIKLDKCGGLTEALMMVRRARELELDVMVGNMIGTSLAMIPAIAVGQLCGIVDLDGPLPLLEDRQPSVIYRNGEISLPP